MNELRAGVYRHYKGLLVMVLGAARHSETEEKLVAYLPIGVKPGPRITVRPYDNFFGSVNISGIRKPRFEYLGEDMPSKLADSYDKFSGYAGDDRIDD